MHEIYDNWLQGLAFARRINKLFIVGCGKSGTSWVLNLLNGHPEMIVRGEGRWAWALLPGIQRAVDAFNTDQSGRLDLAQVNDTERACLFRAIIERGLVRYLADAGGDLSTIRVVGDKTPQHALALPALAALFPEAKFIHIVRDPRDAAVSGWHHDGVKSERTRDDYTRHFMTEVWPAHVGAIANARAGLGARLLDVRYEDLHADESAMTLRMLRFLDVRTDDAALGACMESGSFQARSGGRRIGEEDRSSHYRKGVIGDGSRELDAEVVRACMAKIAALAARHGYATDPVPVSA